MNWHYAYTPYIWPMLLTAGLLLVLGAYAWRRRAVPAAVPFLLLVLAWVLWALGSALEFAAVDPPTKWFWFQAQAAFKVPMVTFGLIFVLAYAGLDKWLTRTTLTLLALPCLIIPVLIVTNPSHQLGWTGVSIDQRADATSGPIVWATLLYVGFLFLLQVGVLVWLWFRAPLYRWPIALMIGVQTLGRAAYVAEVFGFNLAAPLDQGLVFSLPIIVVYFVALFHFRFFDVVPVGRETAIERMANGVLILNAENRIVDLNPAAEKLLALARRVTIGRPAGQMLAAYPDVLPLLEQEAPADAELTLNTNPAKSFQVQVSLLRDRRGFHLGRLIWLHDVTAQKRVQELELQQQRTQAVMQERERLARDLHDSTGQVLGYVSMQAAAARKLLKDGDLQEADGQLARLQNVAQDAHADVRDFILGLRSGPLREQPFSITLRRYLESFERNFGIHVELTMAAEVETWHLPLSAESEAFRIVQEALTNARRHSAASCIRVALATEQGQARIMVQDDGLGFDPSARQEQAGTFGLRFMRERAEQIGGYVDIISRPGTGTQMVLRVPLAE